MKVFLYVMGIILSCSLCTLRSMNSGKNIIQLVDTLDSLSSQLIGKTINLTPESLPLLVKNFTEQFTKNYQTHAVAFKQAVTTLQNNLQNLENIASTPPDQASPEQVAKAVELLTQIPKNLSDIDNIIDRILPKETIPLFFFFVLHTDPNQFSKERNTILTLNPIDALIGTPVSDEPLEEDEPESKNTSLYFLSFFKKIIENPTETIKAKNLELKALLTQLSPLAPTIIDNFKKVVTNIDKASERDVNVTFNAIITLPLAVHKAITQDLRTVLLNENSINLLKTALFKSLNQVKDIIDFINQPNIWNKIQAKQEDLEKIEIIQDFNAYQILARLKQVSTLSQDLSDITTISDFYTNLFKTKQFNYQEWATIEKITQKLTQ